MCHTHTHSVRRHRFIYDNQTVMQNALSHVFVLQHIFSFASLFIPHFYGGVFMLPPLFFQSFVCCEFPQCFTPLPTKPNVFALYLYSSTFTSSFRSAAKAPFCTSHNTKRNRCYILVQIVTATMTDVPSGLRLEPTIYQIFKLFLGNRLATHCFPWREKTREQINSIDISVLIFFLFVRGQDWFSVPSVPSDNDRLHVAPEWSLLLSCLCVCWCVRVRKRKGMTKQKGIWDKCSCG